MDMSIVIRCGDDPRVFDCINSIDEDVETIVSLNANDTLQKRLNKEGIKYCITPRGNLSLTSNIGVSCASHNKIILTDSDTTFNKDCIKEMYIALDRFPIVRAKISFKYNNDRLRSKLVSSARDYVNSLPLVYTPGIAFRKEIINDTGGFLFNDSVPFAVDADLNYRIKKANIPVKYIKHTGIDHSAEYFKHDLKAAYRIGRGCAISYMSLRNIPLYSAIKWNDLKGVKLNNIPDLLNKKGFIVLLYQLIWDTFYWSGYFSQISKGWPHEK